VQLYSALVYGGLSLVTDIARGLDALLARDGHASLSAAVGTNRGIWL
jgi:dihydroorotate dehydrogenase